MSSEYKETHIISDTGELALVDSEVLSPDDIGSAT